MGAPPRNKSLGPQRINPPGIPFLYLSFDANTAVAETRPSTADLLTVATFKLKKGIRIANLNRIGDRFSPFGLENVLDEVESRRLLLSLSSEFSRPVNPEQAVISYISTQYAAEVIRDAGFAGIMYGSALGPGSNLVLFDPANAEAVDHKLVELKGVQYDVADYVTGWSSGENRRALGWLHRNNRTTIRFTDDILRMIGDRSEPPSSETERTPAT